MFWSLLLLALSAQLAKSALPLGWKACKTNSPDYKKCLTPQIEFAIASLKNGNKKLGIQAIDPLHFDHLDVNQDHGPVQTKLEFKDFTFTGLSKAKILDIKNDWKVLSAKIYYGQVITKGGYKINGKIMVLPIKGEGPCSMVWQNLTLNSRLTFKEVEKNHKKYLQVSKFEVDILPKRVIFKYDNLFNGDKALGDNMNIFLNENWEEIIKDVKPAMSKALGEGFARVANQVFAILPRADLELK